MEVKLHDIGEGMTEAHITHFFVKPGDRVKADEPIVEVQTDKMVAEIPAPRAGIIKEIVVEAGQTISVGTTVMIIEDEPLVEAPSEQIIVERGLKNESVFHQQSTEKQQRILASPYTRKIARENNVNINLVKGSGPAGRITDEDVKNHLTLETKVKEPIQDLHSEKVVSSTDTRITESTTTITTLPFRGRRKQIGKKMQQSLRTIPHCTHFEEIDVTELIKVRSQLKAEGISISATVFFLKALSLSLKEYPIFNARLDEENEVIQLLHDHHIGIATDTEEGLVVPIVRNVEKKTINQIQLEMKELTNKALQNKLTGKDITGGTFTISNVGPLGGSIGATPIINHPEVGLLSFHKTKKMPVVNNQDEIVIRSMMNVSMSFDHRVVDGATAVRFTSHFAKLIENPTFMLLELI
ncbi:dihydrolipoamide acetyltransferase family protein [Bacillus sp. DJP31]|uniref:dihydrolipoamide acetyltransferase family protein n=1 Tax=Bacillus sp. DJP31 TaxID=3409789 RepID=UPI003BB6E994